MATKRKLEDHERRIYDLEDEVDILTARLDNLQDRLDAVPNPPTFLKVPFGDSSWAKEFRAKWGPYFEARGQ
jgi:hypothetical protein